MIDVQNEPAGHQAFSQRGVARRHQIGNGVHCPIVSTYQCQGQDQITRPVYDVDVLKVERNRQHGLFSIFGRSCPCVAMSANATLQVKRLAL
jgi:hypothetical protein